MITRIAITGYKPHELGIMKNNHPGITYIQRTIEKKLKVIMENNYIDWIIITGQLGIELWSADVVFKLKNDYPNLKLAVMEPFYEQYTSWSEEKQEYYHSILEQADFVGQITKMKYTNPSQLKARTQFVLNKTDALLILYDEEKEGSPKYILQDAKRKSQKEEYMIFKITPDDIQQVIEEEQSNHFDDIDVNWE